MLYNLFLLAITIAAILLCLKYKSELEKLKEGSSASGSGPAKTTESEEFMPGTSSLTGEFADHIAVDPLTRLPGRAAFEDRLQQTINQSKRLERPLALLVMDINQLHFINDTKGYDIGDKLLQEVAKRMQGTIRQIDTVTRYAGGTFVFLLPQLTSPETAVYIAQRILDNMVLPFKINDHEILINANVGIAISPLDGEDAKTLLQNANSALLQAKECGKGKYQFYRQELHALGQKELAIHASLCSPDLFEKLSIQYQPYVNVDTDEVVCVRALPVIQLPDGGTVSFDGFARIAENCKKIVEIGEWGLETAAAQFKKWQFEGFDPRQLAVNITLSQLSNSQFIYNASQLLQKHQIQPRQVVFEITDPSVLGEIEFLEKSFSLLNSYGIQIAFSVLAMGHLAVQRITRLPVNYLKIDSKLTQDDEQCKKNEAIIHMLVTLAKDMQIYVVAEGVNNEKQKQILEALDCKVMQGKLFGEYLSVMEPKGPT